MALHCNYFVRLHHLINAHILNSVKNSISIQIIKFEIE